MAQEDDTPMESAVQIREPVVVPFAEAPSVSGGVDITSIMKFADQVQGLANNAARIMAHGAVKSANIIATRIENSTASIPDEVLIKTQELAGKLQAQQNSRAAATAFAVNQDEANQMVTALGKKYVETSTRAVELASEITKRTAVLPWESPLEWLGNQVIIPFKYDELRAVAGTATIAAAALQTANASVQSQAQTENLIAQTLTVESQKAAERLILAGAQDKIRILELQGIALNSANVEGVLKLNTQQLETMAKIHQMQNADEYLRIAKANQAMNETRWRQELKDKLDLSTENASIAATVNAGRAVQGFAPLPEGKIKEIFKLGGEIAKNLQEQYLIGSHVQATGAPKLGDSPLRSAEIITKSEAPLTTEQAVIKDFLKGTAADAVTELAKQPHLDPKSNPKGAADFVNTQMIAAAKSQQKVIKTGDASNIYAIPSLKTVASSDIIQGSMLYKEVLKPLLDTGYDKVDPDDLLSKTMAAVKAGQVPYQEAVNSLTAFFRVGAQLNNTARRYDMFNLPTQTSYNVRITSSFGGPSGITFGGAAITETFDMTKPEQVSVILSRRMAELQNRNQRLFP